MDYQDELDRLHQQRLDHMQMQSQEMVLLPRGWVRTPTIFTHEDVFDTEEYMNKRKENKMDITPDFTGKIKRIDGQFLIQVGCKVLIAPDLKTAAKKLIKLAEEAYKAMDGDGTEPTLVPGGRGRRPGQ